MDYYPRFVELTKMRGHKALCMPDSIPKWLFHLSYVIKAEIQNFLKITGN